jgi:hypothetical protein
MMHPRHHVGQIADAAGQTLSSASDFLGSIPGPYQMGQQLGQAAQDTASGLSSSLGDAASAAQQAYQDQLQRVADLLKQQQMQASGTAKQTGSNLSIVIALSAVGVVLAIYFTRK